MEGMGLTPYALEIRSTCCEPVVLALDKMGRGMVRMLMAAPGVAGVMRRGML
jgi:hypothetical protein